MNREEYLARQLTVIPVTTIDLGEVDLPPTRNEYLAAQLEHINSEVSPCPGAHATPDFDTVKTAYFGLRVECTGCGFTVEVAS